MKATLATLACLLTVGFLSAASVEGNNTAVVIRKTTVMASNGYQFLCVPVDGLDIANGTAKTIKLSTLLPPATLPVNTRVIIGTSTYTVSSDKKWKNDQQEEVGNLELEGGTTLWLNTYSREYPDAEPPAAIVFCGQDRIRIAPNRNSEDVKAGLMNELKNDSSVAISLNEAVAFTGDTRPNDMILTIQEGSSEYKTYFCRNGVWKVKDGTRYVTVTDAEKVIAPGEAFYYYKAE